jgi:predicted nucleic acid-binding protein
MTFVDTSAFLALLAQNDTNHIAARECWAELLSTGQELLTTNYVEIETIALAQRRLGLGAVQAVSSAFRPLLKMHWVSPQEHQLALESVLSSGRRNLSLVDSVSFVVMRSRGIQRFFAFDAHFDEQGFLSALP